MLNENTNTSEPQGCWFPTFNFQNLYLSKGYASMEILGYAVDLDQALHLDAFRKAIFDLEKRFDASRLYFKKTDTGWLQKIHPYGTQTSLFSIIDVSDTEPNKFESLWKTECGQLARSFDLAQPSLLKIVLFRSPENVKNRLTIMVNHLISDGYSMLAMFSYLQEQYHDYLNDSAIPETSANYSIYDYLNVIQQFLKSEKLQDKLQHWLNRKTWSQKRVGFDKKTICDHYIPMDRPDEYATKNFSSLIIEFDKAQTSAVVNTLLERHQLDLEQGFMLIVVHALAQQYGAGFFPVWVHDNGRLNFTQALTANVAGFLSFIFMAGLRVNPELDLHTWLTQAKPIIDHTKENANYFAAAYYNNFAANYLIEEDLNHIQQLEHPECMFNFIRNHMTREETKKMIPLENTECGENKQYYSLYFCCNLDVDKMSINITYNHAIYNQTFLDTLQNDIKALFSTLVSENTKNDTLIQH